MDNKKHNPTRIAKNTILLYGRTLFTLIISLYTSRLILETLGVDDYGIYNVVGGLVSMFSILSSSLSGAISRYITFGIGEDNLQRLKDIFSISVGIQIIMAIIIFIIMEIGGVFLLNDKLNIPVDRLYAANWVFQFSILTFIVGLVSVPYNACIVAHERMSVFAIVTIVEAIIRLGFVIIVYFTTWDKLILYSLLLFVLSLLVRIAYGVYCKKEFKECTCKFHYSKNLFIEIFKFAGWGFLGNTAYVLNTQGVNMAINIFFSVALNAARGIVSQVENAVMQFINNFTTAISPQITKSYAAGDIGYTEKLVYQGAKFSFFLLLFFLMPIEFETETVLALWLKEIPSDSALFLRLSLVCSAITLLGNTSLTVIMATGKIKNYQIIVSLVGCIVFPATWIAYKLGCPAYITYIIYGIIYFFLNFIRLYYMKKLIGFNPINFITKVLVPVTYVSILVVFPLFFVWILSSPGIYRLISLVCCNIIVTPFVIYYVGMQPTERNLIKNKFADVAHRIRIK